MNKLISLIWWILPVVFCSGAMAQSQNNPLDDLRRSAEQAFEDLERALNPTPLATECASDANCPVGYTCQIDLQTNTRNCRRFVARADLYGAQIQIDRNRLLWGQEARLQAWVGNRGNASVSNFMLTFVLSRSSNQGETDDIVLTSLGHLHSVPPNGVAEPVQVNVRLPSADRLPLNYRGSGPYYIHMQIQDSGFHTTDDRMLDDEYPDDNYGGRSGEGQDAVSFRVPTLNIDNVTVNECGAPGNRALVAVHLDPMSDDPVAVRFQSLEMEGSITLPPVSATAGNDYESASGSLTFPAYSPSADRRARIRMVEIPIRCDDVKEPTEQFRVRLSQASGAQLDRDEGLVSIVDTGPGNPPLVRNLSSIATPEGNAGITRASMGFQILPQSAGEVHIEYRPVNNIHHDGLFRAQADTDYVNASQTVVIPPNSMVGLLEIKLIGDEQPEVNEFFDVVITRLENASYAQPEELRAYVQIKNDDFIEQPRIIVPDTQTVWLHRDDELVEIPVQLSFAPDQLVSVFWRTADGDAIAGRDYESAAGMLHFAPGEHNKTIALHILSSPASTHNEIFFELQLSNPRNARLMPEDQGTRIIIRGGKRITWPR